MEKIKSLLILCAKPFAGKGIQPHIVGGLSSYGASNEHLFSIHSAFDGITRRTRLVPHIAAVFFMLFFVGIGNVWGAGETISSLTPASNALGKSYPQPGKRYYVYAQNKNTESDYANQVVFWARATPGSSTKYYQIQQTAPVTDGKVPAAAIIVQIVVENNKPYITTAIDGETEPRLFFQKGATKYLIAQRDAKKDANTTYYEPQWSFTYSNYTYQIKGVSLNGETETWCEVRAKYASGKQNFNTSQTALAYAANNNTAPDWTKWKFVEVPSTWYYSSTPSKSGYASATVEVSKDGTNWSSSIATTSTTSEQIHLYFKASAAPSGYDFLGWYDGDVLKSTDLIYDATVSGTGTSDNPTTFNYVAKYRPWQTVYYKLQGVTETGQEERGSVHVSLNGTDWDEDGEVIGSIVTSAAKPQVTVYFKGVPSGDSYALSSFGYANVLSTINRVTKIGNSSFTFDPSTGVTEAVFEIKNANNHLSEANACLIDLKATFGKKAVYKGTVARTTGSPASGCTVKVAFTQDGLASATTQTEVGSVALGEEETSKNRAIFFEASVDNTDPNRYRFNGWYDNASATGDALSTELSFNKGFAVQFGNTVEQNTFTLYGDFSESTKKYYRAIAAASPNVGTVKAGFSSDLTSASATANANEYNFNASFERTAYFEATVPEGYQFRGWSTTNDESGLIVGATNLTYYETLTVSSTSSGAPTTITRYAIFRVKEAEARMWDADDTDLGTGEFADAIINSNVAKIKLLSSVTLSDPLTITNPVIIDLDGNNLTGSSITINPGSGKEVKFINTDSQGFGKVDLTTEATGVSITSGNLILDGADIQVTGSGANTYGIVVGSGAKFTAINGDVNALALSSVYGLVVNGTAQLDGGTINANSTNSFAVQTNAGSSTSISGSAELIATVDALKQVGGTVSISGGGFRGGGQDITYANANNITLHGGYFAHNVGLNTLVSNPYVISEWIPYGTKFSNSNYKYTVIDRTSSNYPRCVVISKKTNAPKDTIKVNFNTLEAAIAYANNNADDDRDKTILLLESYTLPAGHYTIPKYTILSIPYSAEQKDAMPNLRRISDNGIPESAYCTLTLANGVHIDVFGEMEVGGTQTTGTIDAAGAAGISRPGGPTYGLMQMNSGSSITLYDEANLYAWGFVQGEGTIDVRRGATVKEQFQIGDWKGFTPTALMAVGGSIDYTLHVLPVSQYFIQNVEVKATYRPGSRLKAQVSAYVQSLMIAFNDIGIIGIRYSDAEKAADPDLQDDVAIFLMDNNADSEDTWVRKSYDVANDVQLYEANNSAYLGSLKMDIDVSQSGIQFSGMNVQDLNVDSRDFVLPLTNNFKIHLLYGNLYVTQNTSLLPGSVIEIDKKATMTIMDSVWNSKTKQMEGNKPQTLYLYDKDQWGTYVFDHKDDSYVMGYASRIRYRHGDVPTVRDISSPAGLGDAQLIVHGTVDVKGYLKTTKGDKTARPVISQNAKGKDYVSGVNETTHSSTDGGASIISTIADAGTITLSRDAGYESSGSSTGYVWQVDAISSGGTPSYFGNHAIPAWLTNEMGYTETATKKKGKSFCYIDFDGDGKGEWKSLITDGCFVYDEKDVYYAKPQDYVALKNGKTEEENHTYQSADGSRTLILLDDCQWWEVEPVAGHPDLFHCTHPQNNVYYYYDYEKSKWKEKRYTVTWLDWDGSKFGDPYILKYGVQPKYLGDIPQRDADAYYTYDFIGWSPAITESTIVTGDVTYTAQYERKDVMYTVTWKDLSGATIETGYYKLDEVPSCATAIDMTNKEWTPAIGAVTGNTIYQLTAKNNDGPYDIKFVNWNGDQIGETQSVAKDAMPATPATNPTKPALDDVEFVFAGWRAADNQVYASNAIPAATANAIYTATFTGHPITYAITWKNYDGTTLLVQEVTPKTVPQYTGATPVHAEEGYGFIGWSPTVVAATENVEYVAQFELQNKTVDGATYTVPAGTQTLTTVTITDDGKVEIPATSTLKVNSLILEANSNASGQLDAPANSNIVTVNAYFDWTPNGNAGTANRTWYAIAVPWEVDAENGIFLKETGRHLVLGGDFDLIYYSGSERASVGNKPSCWKYVQHDASKTMRPGQLYMMYFDPGFVTIRFAKKAGAAVLYTAPVNVSLFPESTGNEDKDANWNGIANPKTYYASLSAGTATYAQVLNNGSLDDYFGNSANPVYQTINLSSSKFTVGKPLFVQATEATSVVVTKQTTAGIVNAAPTRRTNAANLPKGIEAVYRLSIAGEDQPEADNLFVQIAEEEKADRYTIGQDLVKGGVASGRAQAWVNRYNTKLSVNTQSLSNDEAVYPLTLQFPSAGDYTLSVDPAENDDYALYLTYDGQAIWNLTNGAYTGSFGAGTTNSYGLRVTKKTPQVATGIDEAIVDAQGETRKVIINDQVFIIRGENVYSVDGQLVK